MEKLPLHTGETQGASTGPKWMAPRQRSSRATFLRRLFIVVCFLAGYFMLIRPRPTDVPCDGCATPGSGYIQDQDFQYKEEQIETPHLPITADSKKIPLEAHIMSKCPDAQGCMQKLVLPAMEKISDKVDFRLSFIASVSKETSDIQCMHGPAECIGNMLMLCAANLPFPPAEDKSLLPNTYPRTPIIRSLGFANCLMNDYPRIPARELVLQCALEHGIDFDALNTCASQQDDNPDNNPGHGLYGSSLSGIALLRESALHSDRLDVHTSCTVRVDDKVWCVHDGGQWKDCVQNGAGSKPEVLVDEINRLWEQRN
ncbi:hypothetical protein N7528_003039 [Penicillium herquei]|nr:hypothetical protein N7528_003039 [Penicillium herquei]